MGFTFNRKLPIPKEIKADYPLSANGRLQKEQRDKEIRDVITGADDRFLIIVGPCSADNETAVMDYCTVWFLFRRRSGTNVSSSPESIPTSRVRPERAIKAWCISPIRRPRRICWKA